MNILIVGNGFDLSHYLPTKYDHFMVAMAAIENWDDSQGDMSFDDLFGSLYEKEGYFFGYTKSMYKTDEIKISTEKIKELKHQLAENVWYKYFFNHVNHIDTWIDFETGFAKALDLVATFSEQAEDIYQEHEEIRAPILRVGQAARSKHLQYGEKTIKKMYLLNIFTVENQVMRINQKYYRNNKLNLDINSHLIIENLERNLKKFIKLFDWYLVNIVEKLNPHK